MATGYLVKTPRMAHELAAAMGHDAANQQMRKAGRSKWNREDYNLAADTTQRWYSHFGILNAESWMPEGYEWREVRGEWRPMLVRQVKAA